MKIFEEINNYKKEYVFDMDLGQVLRHIFWEKFKL